MSLIKSEIKFKSQHFINNFVKSLSLLYAKTPCNHWNGLARA